VTIGRTHFSPKDPRDVRSASRRFTSRRRSSAIERASSSRAAGSSHTLSNLWLAKAFAAKTSFCHAIPPTSHWATPAMSPVKKIETPRRKKMRRWSLART
jgi:hypothetical protein